MVDEREPRWLTDEQSAAWLVLMSLSTWLPAALDAQLQRAAGLTHVEYGVLAALSMAPERQARMSAVASFSNVNLSHLSRIVARLEKSGWVRRTPDPTDGRSTLAILTPAGWDKVVASAPGHAEEAQRLVFDNLTATQVRQLTEIGCRVMEVVKPGIDHLPDGPWRAAAVAREHGDTI